MTGGEVKVLDLGLARHLYEPAAVGRITGHGQFLGTLDYVAPTWRSWPGPRRACGLNGVLSATYSVLRGCDFPRIHVRLSWSATVDLPSKRQWWAGSKLPPFRRAHISALRPSLSLHPKPSLVVTLSAAARTQIEALRRQDMLPLGHQLSIGLAHRADAAVQIVQAQWIDGVLAPGAPSPFFSPTFSPAKRTACAAPPPVCSRRRRRRGFPR